MGKKLMTLLLAGVIAASALTGCSLTGTTYSDSDSSVQTESSDNSSDTADDSSGTAE